VLRGVLIVLAWIAACAGLLVIELESVPMFFAGEIAIAIVAGAAIDRWWAPLAPIVLVGLALLVTAVVDPGCGYCGDDTLGEYAFAALVAAVVPSVLGALIGLALRRLVGKARA
jgi:hypothetical protein